MIRYLSVCSGIEAATVAWHPLGWEPAAFAEIDKFPRAVLAHRFPNIPLHGDFTTIEGGEYGPVHLLVGGTPCQSFSVAGLRKGLADDRGNLALQFLALAGRARPRWIVWENVPGVLSSSGGRDFGAFLGGMEELGYGWAYRVLDAQYFGVPQRRRRVFVVGHLGDWRRAAAVLFERASLQGHPPPRREAGKGIALPVTCRVDRGGEHREAHGNNLIAHSLRADGFDAGEDGTGRGTPLVADTLVSNGDAHSGYRDEKGLVNAGANVRRLTPRECERLQGFHDDWTLVPYRGKPAADGPRYKAIGNSMAVPVMAWIGERIAMVETMTERAAA